MTPPLLAQLLRREPEAVKRADALLYRFVARDQREDAIQDCLLSALRHTPQADGWMIAALRNAARSIARVELGQRERIRRSATLPTHRSDDADREQAREDAAHLLADLRPRDAALLGLIARGGTLTAAAGLGTSRDSVRQSLHRLRRRFRR